MNFTKDIKGTENNNVLVKIYRIADINKPLEIIDSKRFGYTDCSFISFMFQGDKAQRESRFKLAHIWADGYIKQLEEYEHDK